MNLSLLYCVLLLTEAEPEWFGFAAGSERNSWTDSTMFQVGGSLPKEKVFEERGFSRTTRCKGLSFLWYWYFYSSIFSFGKKKSSVCMLPFQKRGWAPILEPTIGHVLFSVGSVQSNLMSGLGWMPSNIVLNTCRPLFWPRNFPHFIHQSDSHWKAD